MLRGRLRPQLRHRRLRLALRPQRDAEPAGAVDPELNAPDNFDSVFNLAQGPPPPVFPAVPANGRVPAAERRLRARAAREAAAAARRRLQRHGAAAADADDVGRSRRTSATAAATSSPATARRSTSTRRSINGFPGVPREPAGRPVLQLQFGWTQDVDYFCNCATNRYDSLQAKLTKRFSRRLLAAGQLHAAEGGAGQRRVLPDAARTAAASSTRRSTAGPRTGIARTASWCRWSPRCRSAAASALLTDASPAMDAHRRRLAVQHEHVHPERPAVQRDVPQRRCRTATPGPNRPDLIGDPDGPQTRDQWFNATPIGEAGSAFGRPATGTFGNLERNALRGPGYWRVDASTVQELHVSADTRTSKCASRR